MNLLWLEPSTTFPNPRTDSDLHPEVPGLIAASENLSAEQLENAYRHGIFPWYSQGQPVLWWSPNPRMILVPQELKISHSFKKSLQQFLRDPDYEIRVDDNFQETIMACATQSRPQQNGTWITHAIIQAYTALHTNNQAHSVEVFFKNQRIGGLYLVNLGAMVFGESMFSRQTDASKIALAALCGFCIDSKIGLIDCQQETSHLSSMGGRPIPRNDFLDYIEHASNAKSPVWNFNKDVLTRWISREQS